MWWWWWYCWWWWCVDDDDDDGIDSSFISCSSESLPFFFVFLLSSLVQLSTAIRWIVLPGEKKDVITVSLSTNLEPGELYFYMSIYISIYHLYMPIITYLPIIYLSIHLSMYSSSMYLSNIYLITRRPSWISTYQDQLRPSDTPNRDPYPDSSSLSTTRTLWFRYCCDADISAVEWRLVLNVTDDLI